MKRKTFKLEIDQENAAFEHDPIETAELLHNVSNHILHGHTEGRIMDSNGNTVGKFWTEKGTV